jgi:hypothetical protein
LKAFGKPLYLGKFKMTDEITKEKKDEKMIWEITELKSGEIVLQSVDGDSEPLITISFSNDAKDKMQHQQVEIAKVMISAGMSVAQQIEEEIQKMEDEALGLEEIPDILH